MLQLIMKCLPFFAVVVLHIALGFYIAHAYFTESDPKHQIGKRD